TRDGNDGPWSTFGINIGTPAQAVRMLPATGQSASWPVLPDGCTSLSSDLDFTTCNNDRGKVFYVNKSSSWQEEGIYELNTLYVENQLGLGEDARGEYGYDTVGLAWSGEGLPSLENMVVGGIADPFSWEGSFPLSPRGVNFTDLNDPKPTILHTLRNETYIPSTSWSYTAGAYNVVPKAYGSLTLGGYDTTRFEANDITIPFGSDISRDLLLAVQSVSTNLTDTPLMSTANYWYIDSLVASMWFPEDVCTAFEDAFGIVWDSENSIYLINDTQHETLTNQNPSLTFTISANTTGASVNITMPYSSLALNASYPVYPNSTRYFPLKRAVNDTQYTLGRAFLQNAYVITDYDRSNFSVHQALFPDSSVSQNLVSIIAPGDETTSTNGTTSTSSDSSSSLSGGAIAGIVIGALCALALLALAFFLVHRRKRARIAEADSAAAAAAALKASGSELDAGRDGQTRDFGVEHKTELEGGQNAKHEMGQEGAVPSELFGLEAGKVSEMEAAVKRPVYEMDAGEVVVPELESGENTAAKAELEGSAVQRPAAKETGGVAGRETRGSG
ncbi:acid protease, partial [Saccharata proteae CBS 121410]